MRKVSVLALVLALVMLMAASSVNAGWAWNQLAGKFHFAGYPQSAQTTLGQAYRGGNFNADMSGIVAGMSEILASPIEPPDGPENVLNAWIESQ